MKSRVRSSLIIGVSFFILYSVGIVPHLRLDSILFWTFLAVILLLLLIPSVEVAPVPQISLMILSFSLALVATDLVGRSFLPHVIYYRPWDRYFQPCPAFPKINRYDRNVRWEGETYGDLAALSGRMELAEKRKIVFQTDGLGFRNDPGVQHSPIDVVILGDSFADGVGMTQDDMLSSVLSQREGINAYNMSMNAGSLRQEAAAFILESGRLPLKNGALVLWLVFTGNDFDDDNPNFSLDDLDPGRNASAGGSWRSRWSVFRKRSFLMRLAKIQTQPPLEKVLLRTLTDGITMMFLPSYVKTGRRKLADYKAHKNWAVLRKIILKMNGYCEARGARLAICVLPDKSETYEWIINRRLSGSAPGRPSALAQALSNMTAGTGVAVLDPKAKFIEESKRLFHENGGYLWWRDDTHWNGRAIEVLAEFLLDEGLLTGGRRSVTL